MNEYIINTYEEAHTIRLGETISNYIFSGFVVCLEGDLGTGKTHFTKGFCKGAGVNENVNSPTFTIVNEYAGNMPIFHFDAYRIDDPSELNEIGFDEYIYGEGACIIEWADLIKEVLPKELLWIKLEKPDLMEFNLRKITITGFGSQYEKIVEELKTFDGRR